MVPRAAVMNVPFGSSSMTHENEDVRRYQVVANDEEQYSIWFADREPPLGWRCTGPSGSKSECLDYIEAIWIDMRPVSLRTNM